MSSYSVVPLSANGDWIDAAWINQYIKDNFAALWKIEAAEDLIVGATPTTAKRLAKGANRTILHVNGAGNLEYTTIANLLQNTAMIASQAVGDLMVGASGTAIKRLPRGTAEMSLGVNAGGTDIEYRWPRLPFCVVGRSSNLSLPASETTLLWNSEPFDEYGWHNNSSDTQWIRPSVAGWYIATLFYSADATAGSGQSYWTARLYGPPGIILTDRRLFSNADGFARVATVTSFPVQLNGSTDQVGWSLQHQDTATRNLLTDSRFSLHRIG